MYTPTHLALGVAGASIVRLFIKDEDWRKLLYGAALGAVHPDIPLILQMLVNYLQGDSRLLQKSWLALEAGEILHSLILWTAAWATVEIFLRKNRYVWFFRSLCVSTIFAHIIVDGMTHGDGEWGQAYLWPTNLRLGQFIGFWMYFERGKPFSIKTGEALTLIASLIITLLSFWYAKRRSQKQTRE